MLRFRLAVAVLVSGLWACGGEEPQPDHRPNVTGTYEVTGTSRLVENGEETISEMWDTLRITRDDSAPNAVRLTFDSFGCGPVALMDGERAFIIQDTQCPLPEQDNCEFKITFREGRGEKLSSGDLQVSLRSRLEVRCYGGGWGVATLHLEMTGEGTGQ